MKATKTTPEHPAAGARPVEARIGLARRMGMLRGKLVAALTERG